MQINMLVVIVRGPKREVPRRAAVLRSCHSAQLDRYSDKNDFANFERLYRMSLYSGRSLPTRRNCSISFKIKAQYLVFRRQKIPIFGSFRISKRTRDTRCRLAHRAAVLIVSPDPPRPGFSLAGTADQSRPTHGRQWKFETFCSRRYVTRNMHRRFRRRRRPPRRARK
jgi:hypothetical protein